MGFPWQHKFKLVSTLANRSHRFPVELNVTVLSLLLFFIFLVCWISLRFLFSAVYSFQRKLYATSIVIFSLPDNCFYCPFSSLFLTKIFLFSFPTNKSMHPIGIITFFRMKWFKIKKKLFTSLCLRLTVFFPALYHELNFVFF